MVRQTQAAAEKLKTCFRLCRFRKRTLFTPETLTTIVMIQFYGKITFFLHLFLLVSLASTKRTESPYMKVQTKASCVFACLKLILIVSSFFVGVCSLSVTKWIHLNWGDDGLITLFSKIWRLLNPVSLTTLLYLSVPIFFCMRS